MWPGCRGELSQRRGCTTPRELARLQRLSPTGPVAGITRLSAGGRPAGAGAEGTTSVTAGACANRYPTCSVRAQLATGEPAGSSETIARHGDVVTRRLPDRASVLDTKGESWFTSCVAYRPTERTEARKAAVRERIVAAARRARGAWRLRRGPGRGGRLAGGGRDRHRLPPLPLEGRPVRRGVPQRLPARGRRGASSPPRPAAARRRERIAAAVETFARRALRGRRLAWALIAEPVDPAVEAERLVFRRAYRDAFADVIADGRRRRRAARPGPRRQRRRARRRDRRGAGRPGVPHRRPRAIPRSVVASLRDFCIRSVTGKEPANVTVEARPRPPPTRSSTSRRRSRATTRSGGPRPGRGAAPRGRRVGRGPR